MLSMFPELAKVGSGIARMREHSVDSRCIWNHPIAAARSGGGLAEGLDPSVMSGPSR